MQPLLRPSCSHVGTVMKTAVASTARSSKPTPRRPGKSNPPIARVSIAQARPTRADDDSDRFVPHVSGIDYGPLDKLVGYAIRRAQLVIYDDFMQALAPWELSPQRYSALTIIARNPGLKQTELGRIIGIARSGVVTVTNALEALGYVERADSAQDKRAFALRRTRRGTQALNKIEQAVRQHDERIAARLTAVEKTTLLRLLAKIGPPDTAE